MNIYKISCVALVQKKLEPPDLDICALYSYCIQLVGLTVLVHIVHKKYVVLPSIRLLGIHYTKEHTTVICDTSFKKHFIQTTLCLYVFHCALLLQKNNP